MIWYCYKMFYNSDICTEDLEMHRKTRVEEENPNSGSIDMNGSQRSWKSKRHIHYIITSWIKAFCTLLTLCIGIYRPSFSSVYSHWKGLAMWSFDIFCVIVWALIISVLKSEHAFDKVVEISVIKKPWRSSNDISHHCNDMELVDFVLFTSLEHKAQFRPENIVLIKSDLMDLLYRKIADRSKTPSALSSSVVSNLIELYFEKYQVRSVPDHDQLYIYI